MDAPTFDDLPLTERAREAAHAQGWRHPTPIQTLVIPHLAHGRDVLARAETGSGKTAAFGLVLTDAVQAPGLQALVLAPTRELAQQIARDLNALAAGAPFHAVPIHGGATYDEQLAALRDPKTTCIVATTGRLLDLLARKQILLDHVHHVILDEADRMLDLGFLPEVERILTLVPGHRQTALFTATLPRQVAKLAHRYMSHPREVDAGRHTPEQADHYRLDIPSPRKDETLLALLRHEDPPRALIFVRTRERAATTARLLHDAGLPTRPLHGDLDQQAREQVIHELKTGATRIVVATDVAARGLDIQGLTHVINHDIPEEAEQYVHRAGRTARAGKSGRVFTLVTENDATHLAAAEKAAHLKLRPYPLTIHEDGHQRTLTLDTPQPPKPAPRGGYARGARPKKEATPPRARNQPEEDDDARDEEKGPEYDLPPSRRRRGD